MKLCSCRIAYLLPLEAARSGPQQAEGESPDENRVSSSHHDRFPALESDPSVRFHHTAEGEDKRPEWAVRGRVAASILPCHCGEVFLSDFGGSSVSVGAWLSCGVFCIYIPKYLRRLFDKNDGVISCPEIRLLPALISAVCIPIGTFGFGWTGRYPLVRGKCGNADFGYLGYR
jgi:hypothetical protein